MTIYQEFIDTINEQLKSAHVYSKQIARRDSQLTIFSNRYDLKKIYNVFIYGVGKASVAQVSELILRLNDLDVKVKDHFAVTKNEKGEKGHYFQSSHPYVSERSVEAFSLSGQFLSKIKEDDLLLICLSGGASALLECPKDNFNLKEIIAINNDLLASGQNIYQINNQRKTYSLVKNGGMKGFVKSKNSCVLVMSDVTNNDFSIIGSGPFYEKGGKNPDHFLMSSMDDIHQIAINFFRKRAMPLEIVNEDHKVQTHAEGVDLFLQRGQELKDKDSYVLYPQGSLISN